MGTRAIRKKNLMWSTAALVLVLLLVPVVLGAVDSLNESVASQYVVKYDEEAWQSFSATGGGGASGYAAEILCVGKNDTGVWGYTELGDDVFYDTEGSVDTMFVPSLEFVTSVIMYYNLNLSAEDLYNSSVSRLHVYFSTTQSDIRNLTVGLYSAEYDSTDIATQEVVVVKSDVMQLTNGTVDAYLEFDNADLLYVMSHDNAYNASHLSIVLYYTESGDEFVEGEQIDFSFTFEGQNGVSESALTPFLVGGLGVFLMVAAVASTDVFDPFSKHEVINVFGKKYYRKKRWVK